MCLTSAKAQFIKTCEKVASDLGFYVPFCAQLSIQNLANDNFLLVSVHCRKVRLDNH